MILIKLHSVCKTIFLATALAVAPLMCSTDFSTMEARTTFPKQDPTSQLSGIDLFETLASMVGKTTLPSVAKPQMQEKSNTLPSILRNERLDLSLSKTQQSIFKEEKVFVAKMDKPAFPQENIVVFDLLMPPCTKRHMFARESYPDFSLLGSAWFSDPLSSFSYYREQRGTHSLIEGSDWSVDDTYLGSFLQSSSSYLEKIVDEEALTASVPKLEPISYSRLMNISVREVADLRSEYELNESLDLLFAISLIDMPYLTSTSNIENKSILNLASYTGNISSVELPCKIEARNVWQEDFASSFIQIMENRQTLAMFHSNVEWPLMTDGAGEVLSALLARAKTVEQDLDEIMLAKNLPYDSDSFFCIDDRSLLVKDQISMEAPSDFAISFKTAEISECNWISLDPPVSRGGQPWLDEDTSDLLIDDQERISWQYAVCDNIEYNARDFAYARAVEVGYPLKESSIDGLYESRFTLAGVYFNEFFAPVGAFSLEHTVARPSLGVQVVSAEIFPIQQQNASAIEAKNVLIAINEDQFEGKDSFHYVLQGDDSVYMASLFPSTFGIASSPLYSSLHQTNTTVDEIAFDVSPLQVVEESVFFLRQPYTQDSERYCVAALEGVSELCDLDKFESAKKQFYPADSYGLKQIIVTTGFLPAEAHAYDMIYTGSLEHDDIDGPYLGQHLDTVVSTPFFKQERLLAQGEFNRFNIEIPRDTLLANYSIDIDISASAHLCLIPPVQSQAFAHCICLAPKVTIQPGEFSPYQLYTSFNDVVVSPCSQNEIYKDVHPDHVVVRNMYYDQEGALLKYHADLDQSIPDAYYLIPLLNINAPMFIAHSAKEPDLLQATSFSDRARIIEEAMVVNRKNRYTNMMLAEIPSLEYLQTDSLGDEFNALVRTVPKKTGDGYLFSVLLSPVDKEDIDLATNHVYFVMDRSSSIEDHRFQVFKKSLATALNYLDQSTFYNIALFDYEVEWLNNEDMIASKRSLKQTKQKLKSVGQRGKSNLLTFTRLIDAIKFRAAKLEEPHTVILLSDGRFMKNIRLQRQMLKTLTSEMPDTFSLFAASVSDNNNLAMLNLLSGLFRGDAVHAKTHSAYGRKLASLTRRVARPIAYSTKVTQIDCMRNAKVFKNCDHAKHLYAGKVFKIYGETKDKNDVSLLVQAYTGNRFINIQKKISFTNAQHSPNRVEQDVARESSIYHLFKFIRTGNGDELQEANRLLAAQNFPLPAR